MSPSSVTNSPPEGFAYRVRKSGEVEITHHGRQAALLRGEDGATFVARLSRSAPEQAQHLMARLTGNYRRGNERMASGHPRNGKPAIR